MADPTPRASALKSGSVDLVESLDPAAASTRAAGDVPAAAARARSLREPADAPGGGPPLCGRSGRVRVRDTSARPGRLCHAVRDAGPGSSADFRFAINGEPTFFSPSSSDPPTVWVPPHLHGPLSR